MEVDMDEDDDLLKQRVEKAAAASKASVDNVFYKDLRYDDEAMDLASDNGTTVESLLKAAKRMGRLFYDGDLDVSEGSPAGPMITLGESDSGYEERPIERLCEALQSGEVLQDLIRILSPRLAVAEKGRSATKRLALFTDQLLDPEGQFRISAEVVFQPDDLIKFNKGTVQTRHERQRRVVACLMEIGFVATHMPGYLGPRMDDSNLGTLGAGEFFGELSLLPLEGGWRHRRTITVVANAMLHALSKYDIERISDRFLELKHRLHDHAEDFEKAQAAAEAASVGVDKWSKTKNSNNKRVATSGDGYDPLALLKEQLSQQDIKLEQMSAALRKLADKQAALEDTQDKKLDKIMQLLQKR